MKENFVVESGTSVHMANSKELFTTLEDPYYPRGKKYQELKAKVICCIENNRSAPNCFLFVTEL